MTRRLRSLERLLVCQRVELSASPPVHRFVARWEQALARAGPPPDPLDLLGALTAARVMPPAGPLVAYLEQSRHDRWVPDARRLLDLIVGVRKRGPGLRPPKRRGLG